MDGCMAAKEISAQRMFECIISHLPSNLLSVSPLAKPTEKSSGSSQGNEVRELLSEVNHSSLAPLGEVILHVREKNTRSVKTVWPFFSIVRPLPNQARLLIKIHRHPPPCLAPRPP